MSGWAFAEGEWHRRVGRLSLVVWKQGGGWPWNVEMGDWMIARGRTPTECGSLDVAKKFAEEAARKFASDILGDLNGGDR